MDPQTASRPQPQVQPCRYKVGKTLGAGSYSVVKECVHIETGRYYAAKVINKRLMAGREHMVRNEIAVLKRVSMGNSNILTLVDYFETMNNLYLVTELALGGELFDRICRKGSYYESDAAELIRATLSAIAYLHDHGIVHRDLKPENLLFRTPEDNAELLIADFGLSRIMDEEQFHVLTTTCGTPGYMAPEIFKKTGHGKPVDIWALGVITYFLLCGYTPFDRHSDFEEMQAILNAEYKFEPVEYWRGVSGHAKDFIRRCLTIDPNRRMTAHDALQHPFVAGDVSNRTNQEGQNLLPTVKKNFNARRTLHAAIDTVRAINKLKDRGSAMASDSSSSSPSREHVGGDNTLRAPVPADPNAMDMSDCGDGRGQLQTNDSGYGSHSGVSQRDVVMGDTYDVPSILRPGSNANRVVETTNGLWTSPALQQRYVSWIDPSLRIRRAIHANDPLLVKRILKSHPTLLHNPDTSPRGLSNSNLHLAASLGHVEVVKVLVSLGHETPCPALNESHQTALMLAASKGFIETVLALVENDPSSISRRDVRGRDAIMEASLGGHDTVLQILLTWDPEGAGEAVRRADVDGNTALHFASSNGNLLVLRTLLAAGADPDRRNMWNWTAISYSATVAAEVYLKGLVAEAQRKKLAQREGEKAGGVRVVDQDDGKG
ncbi:hypothetical protein jhhlp_002969 [Lomentospora prolificans]|uniref:Protein kinase domain-containing protein n=1 Tax=Lomentospora prolificans TaxID=41688 RepID=A0A2N3NFK1_9PEZI|nr:hypothetical protein jhhlp_002969 [Lomentospora prolificans]